jgi:hypothetical protein
VTLIWTPIGGVTFAGVGLIKTSCNGTWTLRGVVKVIPPTYVGIESYPLLFWGGVTRG